MKKVLLALAACLGLSGCVVEERAYGPPVEYCDAYGCRWSPYYVGGIYYHGGYYYYHERYYHPYREYHYYRGYRR